MDLQATHHVQYLLNTANYSITYGSSDLTIHMEIGEEIGMTASPKQTTSFSSYNGVVFWTLRGSVA